MKKLLVQIKGTDNEIIITEREYNLIKDITQMLIIDADYQEVKKEIEVIKPELIEFDLSQEIENLNKIEEVKPATKIQSPKKQYKRKR